MKNIIKIFAAIFLVAGFTNTLKAQVKLIDNLAGAELVQVLTITNSTLLNFGRIGVTSGTGGKVTMGTDGVRNPTGVTIINTGTPKAVAKFDLTGTKNVGYTITLPSTITVKSNSGLGPDIMTIDKLVVDVDSKGGNAVPVSGIVTGTLDAVDGKSSFLLAGSLNISSTQELGIYSGKYDVTVDYQ